MAGRTEIRLFLLQRITAAVMVPLIAVHIAVIFYAVHQGLSAANLLARTQGSLAWAAFYGTFVVAAALHGSLGLRTVVGEVSGRRRAADAVAVVFLVAGLALGFRAVGAVTL